MSSDPYSDEVRAYFANPAHCGDLDGGTVVAVDDQGVRVQLAATHDKGVLGQLRFRAWGCPHFIAACEAFCAAWEGRSVSELGIFGAAEIVTDLSVPVEKTGRILVLEEAVRSLGRTICDNNDIG